MEFGTTNAHLGLDLEGNLEKLMIGFNLENLRMAFEISDINPVVPVIDRNGQFIRLESPPVLVRWIEKKDADQRARDAKKVEEQTKKAADEIKTVPCLRQVRPKMVMRSSTSCSFRC